MNQYDPKGMMKRINTECLHKLSCVRCVLCVWATGGVYPYILYTSEMFTRDSSAMRNHAEIWKAMKQKRIGPSAEIGNGISNLCAHECTLLAQTNQPTSEQHTMSIYVHQSTVKSLNYVNLRSDSLIRWAWRLKIKIVCRLVAWKIDEDEST